jgi:hypothetical protein
MGASYIYSFSFPASDKIGCFFMMATGLVKMVGLAFKNMQKISK